MNLVNHSWKEKRNVSPLSYQYNYDIWDIREAYRTAYEEMCRLLKADIIVQVYKEIIDPENQSIIFRHYINYMNSMMKIIIRYVPDDELHHLYKLMNNVVVQHYVVDVHFDLF